MKNQIGKNNPFYGKRHSDITKRKMRNAHLGKKHSETSKIKMSIKRRGIVFSKKHRKKISEALRGSKSSLWKGGISLVNNILKSSSKYKQWRQDVFIRDDFACQKCDKKGGVLEAHHKKSFAKLLQEAKQCLPLLDLFEAGMLYIPLWDIDNGETLCHKCHKKTKSYGKNGG